MKDIKILFGLTSQGGLIEYNIVTGQSEVYTYQGDERFVNYFSCLTLLKEKLYLGTAGNGMLVLISVRRLFLFVLKWKMDI